MMATQFFIDFWCSEADVTEVGFEDEHKRDIAEHLFISAKNWYDVNCDVERRPNLHIRLTKRDHKDIRKICPRCGGRFKPCGNRKFCTDCTGSKLGTDGRIERPAPKPKPKTLAELQREAREHGMSYGQYVAWKEAGANVKEENT